MANVFAFAETRGGELRKVALEAVTAARAIADATGGGEVHALLTGAPGIAAQAARLAGHGADVVLVLEHAALQHYNAEALAATAAGRIEAGGYRAAIFAASAQGRDLAPRVAAKLRSGLASDVIALEAQGDAIVVRHPVNTGKVMSTLAVKGATALVSLRPGAVTPAASAKAGRVEAVQPAMDPATARVVVKELREGNKGKLDLGEAPIIVAGGRG